MKTASIEPGGMTGQGLGVAAAAYVWDPGVRLFHAGFAIIVTLAAWLGFFGPVNALNWHIATGVAAAALVLFRVVWGFLGPTYARFSSFVFPPALILARARELLVRQRTHYLGHNPLGGAMVVALLAVVAGLTLTGAVALGGFDKQGPLACLTSYAVGKTFRRSHEWLAYLLTAMIVGHLAGVAFESLVGREPLVVAMATGRKLHTPAATVFPRAHAYPWTTAFVVTAVLGLTTFAIRQLDAWPARGVPNAALDPVYAKECGACHMAYPPSLAPRALWRAILAGLAAHFGEDASLDAAAQAHVLAYLTNQAAESADTRAANEMRRLDPRDPLRITATPFWRRTHARIADAVFASKAVGARGACNACHADAASGRFDPQAIAFPQAAAP